MSTVGFDLEGLREAGVSLADSTVSTTPGGIQLLCPDFSTAERVARRVLETPQPGGTSVTVNHAHDGRWRLTVRSAA